MSPQLLPLVLGAATLLLASVLASKASRLGVPTLLLFIVVGMLAGSDGPGGIAFDNPPLAQGLGVMALAFILFSGGLDTRWEDVRSVAGRGAALATLGVLVTAGLTGIFAWWVSNQPLSHGLLLGAIVASTDAAAVFGVLRSRNVRLPGDLRSLLELESGSNDPMAVFLTVGMIGLIQNPQASPLGLIPAFVWQMAVGAALGCVMGALASAAVNRARLEYEGLYPALTVGIVLLTYGLADAARANPFLAVYLAAIVMRRQDFLHKRSLIRFHDGLAWLMQIVMFLALGLQVFPSQLPAVAGTGLAISLFLMLVARPVAVVATLWPARVPWRQQALIAWVGLRGAAPIILGTFPLVAGIPEAARLFDIVFFIVLTSALVQGTSVPWVARLLGLSSPDAPAAADPLDLIATGERDFHEVRVAPVAGVTGKRIVELGLPAGTLIVAIHRNGSTIVPSGGTAIREGDRLLVLSTPEDAARVRTLLEA